MLYDKPPFTPSKDYGYGISGITNVVLKTNHKFDEKIKISDEGKKFIDDCLKKDPNNRPTIDQLRDHEWF
jgi:serine/threonine protein kinase